MRVVRRPPRAHCTRLGPRVIPSYRLGTRQGSNRRAGYLTDSGVAGQARSSRSSRRALGQSGF